MVIGDCSRGIRRDLLLGRKTMEKIDNVLKKKISLANKGPYVQSYGFSSSHVWMWELDHKESWMLKNWCFPFVVLKKTLESPMDSKEIKSINPKGNQPWILIERNDAKVEAPILWPPDVKIQLIGKRLWCWERLRAGGEEGGRRWYVWVASPIQWTWTWQTLGDGEGQGGLAYCCPWVHKELDMSLCPWDFPGKNTEVDCRFLVPRIFLTQGWKLCLLHWQVDLYWWASRAAPYKHHHVPKR